MGVEVLARREVEEVLPRALGLAAAEAVELGLEVGVVGAVDPLGDLPLALARGAGEQVDDRVRVGGDEVERAVLEALLGERRAHRPPPAARHARVADGAAAEHPHAQVQPALVDVAHPLGEALAPGAAQPRPVLLRAAERGRALGRRGRVGQAVGGAQLHAQLVPLDLVGDERGDQVVEVGARREQHRERALAVVEPAAPAGGRLERVPVLDRADARALEDDRLLAHRRSPSRRRPRRAAARVAYRKAPRSRSSEAASGCRLEFIERWLGSSTRTSVSPDERSSVVYVRW